MKIYSAAYIEYSNSSFHFRQIVIYLINSYIIFVVDDEK